MALHWRTAKLPENTALFAIGDVHANCQLLAPLLRSIEQEIANLPQHMRAEIIFVGDYIDRGRDSPTAVEMLLAFERSITIRAQTAVTFLCGNHDEYFMRLIRHRGVVDRMIEGHERTRDLIYTISTETDELYLNGLETWFFVGGGVTTLLDYHPTMDQTLFDMQGGRFRRDHPDFSVAEIEKLLQQVVAAIPQKHRQFFERAYMQRYAIVGEYLLTHAGVDPARTLPAQGIIEGAHALRGKALIDLLMIRNPFLWQESLPHCPYVVIHGHTPSDIMAGENLIADGQKDYRLCIDTAAYAPQGGITCFVRVGRDAYFMMANQEQPGSIARYCIGPREQQAARQFHEEHYAHYHGKAV